MHIHIKYIYTYIQQSLVIEVVFFVLCALSASRYSAELQNYRSVIYYLPPSYTENTLKPYSNLLVMHDGQNLFDPKTSAFGTAWMVHILQTHTHNT